MIIMMMLHYSSLVLKVNVNINTHFPLAMWVWMWLTKAQLLDQTYCMHGQLVPADRKNIIFWTFPDQADGLPVAFHLLPAALFLPHSKFQISLPGVHCCLYSQTACLTSYLPTSPWWSLFHQEIIKEQFSEKELHSDSEYNI